MVGLSYMAYLLSMAYIYAPRLDVVGLPISDGTALPRLLRQELVLPDIEK
jgi:hypothetical protein